MVFSIRKKLVIAISGLMILIFTLAAYLFISEKKVEMAQDIYVNSLAFSKLTASDIAENYDLYLAHNGFVFFNREIKEIFAQNTDVNLIKVMNYQGEVLYDSSVDVAKRYEGETRVLRELELLSQIRSENISMMDEGSQVYYLKEDSLGNVVFVNENEERIGKPEAGTLIDYFVVPASEKYSVQYGISYENLEKRIEIMVERIVFLALFAVMIGMLMSFVMSAQLTRPLGVLVAGVKKIATGDFKTRVDIKTSDEIRYLGNEVNKMAVDLEVSMEARMYKERVASELKIATDIQNQLIPKEVPKYPSLDIAAGIIPAGEIGGDMYDFIPISEDRLMFYLGDVTGHGVPAGIVSSIASALFYGYSKEIDLKKIMIDVNRVLKAKTMSNMFMTLCLMDWEERAKKFRYVSAGHEQIIHYKAATGEVALEPAGGLALGMAEDIKDLLKVVDVDLQVGDYLVIYSDGIPEAWRNEKECYGMERFVNACKQYGADLKSAEALKKAFLSDVEQFVAGYKQTDDITLIVVKRDD
ncbi:PP2C family protein-serine/threonine phosphatase [Patescibacteria group bacterium]|nr:PP2C family protein-serine/threonine phosphatase [Patescibacteria group bacterium]